VFDKMKPVRTLALLASAGAIILNSNCGTMGTINPFHARETPVGNYIIVGESTMGIMERALSGIPIHNPNLEDACRIADVNGDGRVELPEARKYYSYVQQHYGLL